MAGFRFHPESHQRTSNGLMFDRCLVHCDNSNRIRLTIKRNWMEGVRVHNDIWWQQRTLTSAEMISNTVLSPFFWHDAIIKQNMYVFHCLTTSYRRVATKAVDVFKFFDILLINARTSEIIYCYGKRDSKVSKLGRREGKTGR